MPGSVACAHARTAPASPSRTVATSGTTPSTTSTSRTGSSRSCAHSVGSVVNRSGDTRTRTRCTRATLVCSLIIVSANVSTYRIRTRVGGSAPRDGFRRRTREAPGVRSIAATPLPPRRVRRLPRRDGRHIDRGDALVVAQVKPTPPFGDTSLNWNRPKDRRALLAGSEKSRRQLEAIERKQHPEDFVEKPTRKVLEPIECPWCGDEFAPKRISSRFCSPKCQRAHVRELKRDEVPRKEHIVNDVVETCCALDKFGVRQCQRPKGHELNAGDRYAKRHWEIHLGRRFEWIGCRDAREVRL